MKSEYVVLYENRILYKNYRNHIVFYDEKTEIIFNNILLIFHAIISCITIFTDCIEEMYITVLLNAPKRSLNREGFGCTMKGMNGGKHLKSRIKPKSLKKRYSRFAKEV